MKKLAFVLMIIAIVLCLMVPAVAEDDSMYGELCVEEEDDILSGPVNYVPAEPNLEAVQADFIGEWKAVYRTVNDQLEYNTDNEECVTVTDHGVFFLGGYAGVVINILSLRTFGGEVKASFQNGAFSTGSEEDGSIRTELLQDDMLKVTIFLGGEETVIYYVRAEAENNEL